MKHVIMAMSKSAWSEGRTGARKEQDWYLVVQEAVRIKKQQGEDSVVVAVTGFTNVTFSLPEIECYKQALLDFDLKEERTKDWDDEDGTPRKYIYGKGQIGGGKNRIRIETINGNVYLKKGK